AQSPPACLCRINPGIVEQAIIREPEVARVAGVDSGEPLDAGRKMLVCVGPIDQPPSFAPPVTRGESEAAMILRPVRVFNAHEMILGSRFEGRVRRVFPHKSLCE